MSALSFLISVLVVIKDLMLMITYLANRKNEGNTFRPQSFKASFGHKLDLVSMEAMTKFFTKQVDNENHRDGDGNSKLHMVVRQDEDLEVLEQAITDAPYELFMLNKRGQTPLDIYIEDDIMPSALEATQDIEAPPPKNLRYNARRGRNMTAKIMDESQTKALVEEKEGLEIKKRLEQDERYHSWMKKTLFMLA